MKKTLLALTLGAVLSAPAFAVTLADNTPSVGVKYEHTRINGDGANSFGVTAGNRIAITPTSAVNIDGEFTRSRKLEDGSNVNKFKLGADYAHGFAVGENVYIAPVGGVTYKHYNVKNRQYDDTGSTDLKLNAVTAKVGVRGQIQAGSAVVLEPGLAYSYDVYAKAKADTGKMTLKTDVAKAHGVETSLKASFPVGGFGSQVFVKGTHEYERAQGADAGVHTFGIGTGVNF